jgi:hypothetical protein
MQHSNAFTNILPVQLNTNTFGYCLTDFTQCQLMKSVNLQRFKGGSVIEGIMMSRALGFF